MAKPLNRGYVGHRMSRRAHLAIQRGELPLSMFTRRKLAKAGVNHSLSFVRWLCRNGYVRPTSRHHRGNPPTLTRFYHPKHMAKQIRALPVSSLVKEWKEWRRY